MPAAAKATEETGQAGWAIIDVLGVEELGRQGNLPNRSIARKGRAKGQDTASKAAKAPIQRFGSNEIEVGTP